jgi:uncharacterized protein YPO0396
MTMTDDQYQTLLAGMSQTNQAVQGLQHHVDASLTEMRRHLDGSLGEVRREIAETRDQLRTEMGEMRDELRSEIGESRRHVEILTEDLRGQIQIVAEGFVSLGERIDAGRRETAAELADIRALIRVSYADLDRRVTKLERPRRPSG